MRPAPLAVILATAIGCGGGPGRQGNAGFGSIPVDYGGIQPASPGVSCRIGDSLDPLRGCVGGVLLHGGVLVSISYKSELGASFVLTDLSCLIDEHLVFQGKGISLPDTVAGLYEGAIPPGKHELRVSMMLRGHGEGVFSYLSGYKFQVRSSHSFTASLGSPVRIVVSGYEKGSRTTPLEERPAVRFTEEPWARIDRSNATQQSAGAHPRHAPAQCRHAVACPPWACW